MRWSLATDPPERFSRWSLKFRREECKTNPPLKQQTAEGLDHVFSAIQLRQKVLELYQQEHTTTTNNNNSKNNSRSSNGNNGRSDYRRSNSNSNNNSSNNKTIS